MIQKAMLTGAMCAIAPGSPVQLLVAMLICLAYLVAIVYAGPCEFRLLLLTMTAFTFTDISHSTQTRAVSRTKPRSLPVWC